MWQCVPGGEGIDEAEDHFEIGGAVGGQAGAHVGGHGVGDLAEEGQGSGAVGVQLGEDRSGGDCVG